MMDEIQPQFQNTFKRVKSNGIGAPETMHYSAFYKGVPNEYKTYAETELKETPENMSRGIKFLKKFLKDKNIPQTDDNNLVFVLRNCKYNYEKSKVKLEKYLKARKFIVERVAELDLEKADLILRDTGFAILPYRDKHGRIIFMTKPTVNLELYTMDEVFMCYFSTMLYLLTFPMTSLFGLAYIAEAKSPSVSILYAILMAYKKYLKTWFDLPIALKKIDITNESCLIRWFMSIMRPVVPTKIYQRITLNGDNIKRLQEIYHPDLLPEEFEGNLGPISSKLYREEVLDFIRKLKEEHRVNNTKT